MLLLKARAGSNDNLETNKRACLSTENKLDTRKLAQQSGSHCESQSSGKVFGGRLSIAASGEVDTTIGCRSSGGYEQPVVTCTYPTSSSYYQHQQLHHDHFTSQATNYGLHSSAGVSTSVSNMIEPQQQQPSGGARQLDYPSVGYYTNHPTTDLLNSAIQPHQAAMPGSIATSNPSTALPISSASDSSGGIEFPLVQAIPQPSATTLVYEAVYHNNI